MPVLGFGGTVYEQAGTRYYGACFLFEKISLAKKLGSLSLFVLL